MAFSPINTTPEGKTVKQPLVKGASIISSSFNNARSAAPRALLRATPEQASAITAPEAATPKPTPADEMTAEPDAEDHSAAIAAQPIPASADEFDEPDTQPFDDFNFSASDDEGSLLGLQEQIDIETSLGITKTDFDLDHALSASRALQGVTGKDTSRSTVPPDYHETPSDIEEFGPPIESPGPSESEVLSESPAKKRLVPGALGDQVAELHELPKRISASDAVVGWSKSTVFLSCFLKDIPLTLCSFVVMHMSRADFTIDWVEDLRGYIVDLNTLGTPAGPVLAAACFPTWGEGPQIERKIDLAPLDVSEDYSSFYEFFSLGTNRKRIVFEPLVAALIYHHLVGAIEHKSALGEDEELGGCDEMCGCCERGSKLPFKSCRSVMLNGFLMLWGTCTNCYAKSAGPQCSFTRKFPTTSQTSTSLVSV